MTWRTGAVAVAQTVSTPTRPCENASPEHGPVGMGTTMYIGVRIGAPPWYPFPFRWGYGWDWPHGYDCVDKESVRGESTAGPAETQP